MTKMRKLNKSEITFGKAAAQKCIFSHARKQRSALKVPDRWVYLRDWQQKQPIASQDHHREALLKSHHGALPNQQMADASWRIPHERKSRWSASERTWREDFYASPAEKVDRRRPLK